MKTPLISVVIPSYNKVKHIAKTLESIVSQSYKNYEVIIQDGGSTDGTLEIIREYSTKYPKYITFVSKKDNGQLGAVNTGMKRANGEILTYINADDYYTGEVFKKLTDAYLKNTDALWFVGKGGVVNEKGEEIAKLITKYKNFLLNNYSHYLLLMTNFLMQPSVFFIKKAYQKYGPFTGTKDFIMEYDLWLILSQIKKPIIINLYLSNFRLEPSTKTGRLFKTLLKVDEDIVKKYTNNKIILLLHKIHNLGRKLLTKII